MISYTEKKQWYEFFFSRSKAEQYEMFNNLLNQAPSDNESIKDNLGTIAVDLKSNLIHEKKYDEVIDLIGKTKKSTKKSYQKEVPDLSNFTVEYYLYKGDMKKTEEHLQPFINHLDNRYDLFIPLYNKIRYYKKNDLALSIAKSICEPNKNRSMLMSGAELKLADIIIYNLLENYFTSLTNGQEPNSQNLEAEIKIFNSDNDFFKTDLPRIIKILKNISENNQIMTQTEWTAYFHKHPMKAYHDLFWQFAVYMLRKGNIDFSVSHDIWFTFFKVLKKSETYSDFSFRPQDLEEVVSGFLSNREEEAFALLWGIPHIYDFLDGQHLVAKTIKEQSLQHVKATKERIVNVFHHELWRFDFVHSWEKPTTISIEEFKKETETFHQSFLNHSKVKSPPKKTVPKDYQHFSLYDELFGEPDRVRSKTRQSRKDKKQKQKNKQRQRNRRK